MTICHRHGQIQEFTNRVRVHGELSHKAVRLGAGGGLKEEGVPPPGWKFYLNSYEIMPFSCKEMCRPLFFSQHSDMQYYFLFIPSWTKLVVERNISDRSGQHRSEVYPQKLSEILTWNLTLDARNSLWNPSDSKCWPDNFFFLVDLRLDFISAMRMRWGRLFIWTNVGAGKFI